MGEIEGLGHISSHHLFFKSEMFMGIYDQDIRDRCSDALFETRFWKLIEN
jgi:hypothetical protein